MARCKTFEIARLSFKQLMCQQGQKEHTQYSLALVKISELNLPAGDLTHY